MLKILLERGRLISVVQVYAFGSLIADVNITEADLTIKTKSSPADVKTLNFGCRIDKQKVTVQTSPLGDYLSVRAPVLSAPDDGVSYTSVLLRCPPPIVTDLYCKSMLCKVYQAPFARTLVLPSKHWREISDLWTCEVDDFQQSDRDRDLGPAWRVSSWQDVCSCACGRLATCVA